MQLLSVMSSFNFDNNFDDDSDGEEGETFNWGGRDATVFLIDSSPQMHIVEDGCDESPFKRAMKCANATLCRKIISQDQDLTAVVLFNTEQMNNTIDCPHIYILQNLDRPGAERVLELEGIINGNRAKFDKKFGTTTSAILDDSLGVCRTIFTNCLKKLNSQSILLFTCIDDPHPGDQQKKNQACKRVQDFREADIDFEVLHMGSNFNIEKFYKDLILLEDDDDDTAAAYTLSDPTNRLEELLDRVRRVNHKQRSSGRVNFTLAPGLDIDVSFYTTIRKTTKPPRVKLYKVTNEEVSTMRKEYLEETGQLLMPSDFQMSQTYGGKQINFSTDEVKGLKKVYEPSVQLLGFKPMSCLKPYLYIRSGNFIYANDTNIQGSTKIFAALLDRCLARKVVPIVRVVPRKSASVAWAALVPQAEELDDKNCQITPPGFTVSYLPFADDFRTLDVENTTTASADQIDAAKNVIKKLNFKYHPDCFENPDLQTHWRNIEALALNRSELEPIVDYTVPDHARMKRKASDLLEEFKSCVYEDNYDPMANIKKPTVPAAKKPKPSVNSAPISIEDMAKNLKLDKLKVDELKSWLQPRGIRLVGKKKADLMQDVYDELGIDN